MTGEGVSLSVPDGGIRKFITENDLYIPLLSHNLLSAAKHLTKLDEVKKGLAQKLENNYQRHGFLGMKILMYEMGVDTLLEATMI